MGIDTLKEEIPIEAMTVEMDRAGVDFALLSAWWGPQGPLISNDEVAGVIQRFPKRFAGIASVNLLRPMEAIRELRRCVHTLGFKGLRILQWLWKIPPTDRHYYPLYAECVELGVPICFQVGHTGPLCPSDPGRPIPYIDEVGLDFPELIIVCGHIGYPWTVEMIALATKYENVYIDTSAYVCSRYPAEIVSYMKKNGKRKVLFGSNYPMITAERCLRDLDSLELGEETRRLFLCENAQRVFKLQ